VSDKEDPKQYEGELGEEPTGSNEPAPETEEGTNGAGREFGDGTDASDDDVSSYAEGAEDDADKLSPDDPSLSLIAGPTISKKNIKMIAAGLGGILLVGLIMTANEPAEGGGEDGEQLTESGDYRNTRPDDLRVQEGDYFEPPEDDPPRAVTEEPSESEGNGQAAGRDDGYGTYDRRSDPVPVVYREDRESQEQNEQTVRDTQSGGERGPAEVEYRRRPSGNVGDALTTDSQRDQEEEAKRRSNIFFSAALPSQRGGGQGSGGRQRSEAEALADAQNMTEYEKLNQQEDKREFLENRQPVYNNYLNAPAQYAVAPGREIKAGTVIPIVMVTAINSDLPGVIKAQVVSPVYDTATGMNLLIPAGSTVVGDYDSAVTWGQERVLVVWERIIRPDGVSLALGGFSGIDKSGQSGYADQVDRHFSEIASSVGLSSAFRLTVNATAAALSSVEFLRNLGQLSGGDQQEIAEEIAKEYAQRALDRQPTIKIRAGIRGAIMVGKDMIIPEVEA